MNILGRFLESSHVENEREVNEWFECEENARINYVQNKKKGEKISERDRGKIVKKKFAKSA